MKYHPTLLSHLLTFEITSRYSSFTQAAKQANITTGAISQQMLRLESMLDVTLFERHSRGIKLTATGLILRDGLKSGFDTIDATLQQVKQQAVLSQHVHLKLTPSFAFKWLVPRLQSFYRQYPDITITTYAESGLVDHQNKDFDLAIDYGTTPYSDVDAQLLIAEQLRPVMSPQYLAQLNWPVDTAELTVEHWQTANLLHDAMMWPNAKRWQEWQSWLLARQTAIDYKQGYFFNRTDMAMAAAEAGVGIAMARCALITDELSSKRLVSPFAPIAANAGYYLIEHKKSPATQCFKKWLFEQVGK